MKIDLICNDGSPIGVTVKDLYGEGNRGIGVGGSEYALLTMCEEWHKAGYEVVLYNNPITPEGSPFEQRNLSSFNPLGERDVLIIFRSPNTRAMGARGLKVWWSCDQQTIGDFAGFAGSVNKIVCISPRHAEYFAQNYNIHNTTVIDIPVRMEDFDAVDQIKKIPNRIIFTSVPGRGLDNLYHIYPHIHNAIPDVSLAITSDYRLWGVPPSNEHFISAWAGMPNTLFFGALPRRQYVEELMKSQITLYPCNYDELFCVAIAESQYASSYPITSACGALSTTNMGTVLGYDANNRGNDGAYANAVIEMLSNLDMLEVMQKQVYKLAKYRFNPSRILDEWNKVFN